MDNFFLNKLRQKTFLISGYGVTGVSAKDYFQQHNIKYFIYDYQKKSNEVPIINNVEDIPWQEIDFILCSPGIKIFPKLNIILAAARDKAIPVMSDLDLIFLFNSKSKFICITGSEGKSTTHDFLSKVLDYGHDIGVGGNDDFNPALSLGDDKKVYLFETSVQMLFLSNYLLADIGVITNIYDTHYELGGYSGRIYNKQKILLRSDYRNQKFVVSDVPNGIVKKEFMQNIDLEKTIICFTSNLHKLEEAKVHKNWVYVNYDKDGESFIQYYIFGEEGKINLESEICLNLLSIENIGTCFAVAFIEKVPVSKFLLELKNYKTLQHRIQNAPQVINKNKKIVSYFNCSKCTNSFAFSCIALYIDSKFKDENKKNLFIIGGKLNSPVEGVYQPILTEAYKILLYGEDGKNIYDYLKSEGLSEQLLLLCENSKEAIEKAKQLASETTFNLNVWFVPCCPSFDEYKNYKERGDYFINQVNKKEDI